MPKGDKLSHQQRLFAHEYLIDRNGTQAAIRAGYAESGACTEGVRLLRNARVMAIVSEGIDRLVRKTDIKIEEVVAELCGILLADPIDMLDADGDTKPLAEWPASLHKALSGFDVEVRELQDGKTVRTKKPRFWSKTESAKQLLMHLGGFARDNEQKSAVLSELIDAIGGTE